MAALLKEIFMNSFPGAQALRLMPSSGLSYQMGNMVNKATNNAFPLITKSVFGTEQPQKSSASTSVPGQVAGATYTETNPIGNAPYGPSYSGPLPTNNFSGGGSAGGDSWLAQLAKMDRNPAQENEYQQMLAQAGGDVAALEAQTRNEITSGYDSLSSNLQGLIPFYQGQQNQGVNSVRDIYGQIRSGLGQTKQTALDKLGANRGQVQQRVSNSVSDLQNNLRDVVRNTGMQLGAMGAGDTSASQVMAPYAYTKLAGNEYGKIQRQGNEQMFTIDQQEKDTTDQYNQMINDSQIEEEQQIQGVMQQYGGIIAQIQQQIAQVPADRAQALAGLSQQLLAEAQSKLSGLQQYYLQQNAELKNWAQNRVAQLNDARIQLSNSANFSPTDITWQELQARNMVSPTSSSAESFYNPAVLAKRKQELGY